MLVIMIALTLVGLEAMRRQKRAVLVTEFQFQFFKMRDDLRDLAVHNESVRSSWVFAYLDSTTAKAVEILPRMSVWKLITLETIYKNDARFAELSKNLERELAKPQFIELKKYANRLMWTLGQYLSQRHRTLHVCVDFADRVSDPVRITVTEMRKRSLDVAVKSPETSTLSEYAPGFTSQVPCPV
jgi:hypothetical protein